MQLYQNVSIMGHAMPSDETSKHTETWAFGVLLRWQSAWVGVHYGKYNKRFCINIVPFVTVWIVMPGGQLP